MTLLRLLSEMWAIDVDWHDGFVAALCLFAQHPERAAQLVVEWRSLNIEQSKSVGDRTERILQMIERGDT